MEKIQTIEIKGWLKKQAIDYIIIIVAIFAVLGILFVATYGLEYYKNTKIENFKTNGETVCNKSGEDVFISKNKGWKIYKDKLVNDKSEEVYSIITCQ